MQTKFQREGVKLTWQERWAIISSRINEKGRLKKLNDKLDHWWLVVLIGLGSMTYLYNELNPKYVPKDVLYLHSFTLYTLVLSFVFIIFIVGAFLIEERKGMRRLIERYEAELAEKDEG